jgi:metallo-beta-lactamase class B
MDADVAAVQSTGRGRPGAHVDRVLHDSDIVNMGGARLVAHLTPGHTKGCTTWTMKIRQGDKITNVVIVGSPNVNSGYYLVGNKDYPTIAEDYTMTFAVLHGLPCDVFLGAHGEYFGMKAKYEKFKAGDKNAFIDPAGYKAYVDEREHAFREELARQKAHPGSPKP